MRLSRGKFLVLISMFLMAGTVFAQTPTPPAGDERIETIITEEVKLNISAFDLDGQFVSDVRKEDLVILEDDRIHQANSLRRIPANVLIVLDTGGEMRRAKRIDQTRETAKNLVMALLPEDSVAIMQYNDTAEIIAEWTENKDEIISILNKKLNFGRRSLFYQAVHMATTFLNRTPLENRHLVLITDGTDSFNDETLRNEMMRGLLASSISVHVISYTRLEQQEIAPGRRVLRRGEPNPQRAPDEVISTMPNGVRDNMRAPRLGSISTDREFIRKMREREDALVQSEQILSDLARDTNGQFLLPATKEEMREKPGLVARVIDSSYVVTYTPKRPLSGAPKGETRQVVVTSKRSGLDVQARRKIIIQ